MNTSTYRLSEAIGYAEDEFIKEASPLRDFPAKNTKRKLTFLLAACLLLMSAVGVGIGIFNRFGNKDSVVADRRWPIKVVDGQWNGPLSGCDGDELAYEPKWDEKKIYKKYPLIALHHTTYVTYGTRGGSVGEEKIGTFLASVTASGRDIYTDTTHTVSASIYTIDGILSDCAVAVRFEGDEAFYAYTNAEYVPTDLGSLCNDLRLESNLTFGSVYLLARPVDAIVEFEDVPADIIWERLLSDRTLKAVPGESVTLGNTLISISVNLPLLGYQNVSLWLTDNGYLVTNLLETAKIFEIGTEKAIAFVNHVVDNYTGYELVFETPDTGEGIME